MVPQELPNRIITITVAAQLIRLQWIVHQIKSSERATASFVHRQNLSKTKCYTDKYVLPAHLQESLLAGT